MSEMDKKNEIALEKKLEAVDVMAGISDVEKKAIKDLLETMNTQEKKITGYESDMLYAKGSQAFSNIVDEDETPSLRQSSWMWENVDKVRPFKGKIFKWFNIPKWHGLITPDDWWKNIPVTLYGTRWISLDVGDEVKYDLEEQRYGTYATKVQRIPLESKSQAENQITSHAEILPRYRGKISLLDIKRWLTWITPDVGWFEVCIKSSEINLPWDNLLFRTGDHVEYERDPFYEWPKPYRVQNVTKI